MLILAMLGSILSPFIRIAAMRDLACAFRGEPLSKSEEA
jgi:hypothetical protein